MNRWVHVLMLVIVFAFQAGAVLSVLSDCCPDETAAQCATDQCGEDCSVCLCASDRPALSMPMVVLPAPPAPAHEHAPHVAVAPPEGWPGDILHIPEPALV